MFNFINIHKDNMLISKYVLFFQKILYLNKKNTSILLLESINCSASEY